MLTGDNARTAKTIGGLLGIERLLANALPGEKAGVSKELQREGKVVRHHGPEFPVVGDEFGPAQKGAD